MRPRAAQLSNKKKAFHTYRYTAQQDNICCGWNRTSRPCQAGWHVQLSVQLSARMLLFCKSTLLMLSVPVVCLDVFHWSLVK